MEETLNIYLNSFPVTGITGPRQSGKSTMLKKTLGDSYEYVTFDDPMTLDFFTSDPRGFLKRYSNNIIFDEVQKAGQLFNYIKIEVDNDRDNYGKYILTGSSQFSLLKQITESLAGRIGLLSLLPFQFEEIEPHNRDKQILFGSYPELVMRNYNESSIWYAAYINNYIERDVRSLYNIGNLRDFQKLIQLLAARVSQELNFSRLAGEIGVTVKTIQSWISVLETSYIIFLLPSYHKNLGKRIVKRPKIYFYDTGIINYLTGVTSKDILEKGPLAGPVFENYIVSEIKKAINHENIKMNLYYFRTNLGLEADLVMEDREKRELSFIEIKNNNTAKYKMIENIIKLIELEKNSNSVLQFNTVNGKLVYRGKRSDEFGNTITFQNYKDFIVSV